MIDSSEPKDGDFVAYVEKLVRLPAGARPPAEGASPGEVTRDQPDRGRLARRIRTPDSRPGGGGGPAAHIEQATHDVVRKVARVLGRVATLMLVAGIALTAIAFADHPPFHVDPMVGVVLAVGGALVRRLTAKAAQAA